MLASLRRVFGKSPQTDMFRALAGEEARYCDRFSRPLGALTGLELRLRASDMVLPKNWLATLDTGTVNIVAGSPPTMTLVTAATINTGPQIQYSSDDGTTAWACFTASATANARFEYRIKASDVTNSAIAFGLATVDTAIFDASSTIAGVADFIGFYKVGGAAAWAGVVRTASTSTSQTLTGYDAVNDTYQDLGFIMNQDGTNRTSVQFLVNNKIVYTQTTLTNLPATTVNLALSIAFDAGASAAKTLTVQPRTAWQELLAA